jgi:predicted aspartyl protease
MKVAVPFKQDIFQQFRLFVVPVLIENLGRSLYIIPMIVDSGASYVTVRPDVFDQLGISPAREIPVVTASQRGVAPLGRVDKVTVSHCSAASIDVISIPFPEGLLAEGLLGASFLRHFPLSMNFDKGILELGS